MKILRWVEIRQKEGMQTLQLVPNIELLEVSFENDQLRLYYIGADTTVSRTKKILLLLPGSEVPEDITKIKTLGSAYLPKLEQSAFAYELAS